jgi:hypothetical protein
MRASVIAYWAAKEGSSPVEYEDAWRVLPATGEEVPGNWVGVAVADGATESLLARQWARMMANEFAAASDAVCDANLFTGKVLALAAQWPAVVGSYIAKRENAARPIQWYERPGIEKGAFATILALQVHFASQHPSSIESQIDPGFTRVIGGWNSAALSDTCLFHVRGGYLKAAFPLSESASFGTSPALLGSSGADPEAIMDHLRFAQGTVAEGDDFFVCTDALAAWFLARAEEGRRPWETLRDLTEIGFTEWVSEARRNSGLRNDDVTLVHMDVW